ncbi:MAG: M15 family metallopeptidase [Bacteroidales bacterium]|nr:M15 family metallopeptidase [Bacteroidales bacterium]
MKNSSFLACIVLTCLIALTTGMTPDPSLDKSDFVKISDEIPEVMLEVRYYTTYNFVGDRINGYNAPVSYITKEAAAALKIASDNALKDGYRIRIYDAYRPQDAVDHFKAWAKDIDDTRMKEYFYPDLDKSVLFKLGYIASRSGHSRGSTVDLTLFDMSTGHNVDMGGTFDFFGELSHPDYKGVTPEQYANRMYLRKLMMDAGFRPYSEEWWHFTLVDEPFPDTYFNFPNE